MNEYTVHCIVCGIDKGLTMLPNRNGTGDMVGWHFVCEKCLSKIAGKETRTEFGQADIPEGTIN